MKGVEYGPEDYANLSMFDALGGVGPYTVEDIKRIERAAVVQRIASKRDRPKAHPHLIGMRNRLIALQLLPAVGVILASVGIGVWAVIAWMERQS